MTLDIFEVWGESPVEVDIDDTGRFRFSAELPHAVFFEIVDGQETRRSESFVSVSYLLRSPGCEDLVIDVGHEWTPHEIYLECSD